MARRDTGKAGNLSASDKRINRMVTKAMQGMVPVGRVMRVYLRKPDKTKLVVESGDTFDVFRGEVRRFILGGAVPLT